MGLGTTPHDQSSGANQKIIGIAGYMAATGYDGSKFSARPREVEEKIVAFCLEK
jgi:hypothetical protein